MEDVLVISGANEGIGYHLTEAWLLMGNRAAALDIRIDRLEALKATYPETLLCIECDMRDGDAVKAAVGKAKEYFGRLDYAVHNACICPFKTLEEISADEYRDVMDVNFMGAVNMAHAAVPFMLAQGKGRICFTSSTVGVTGFIRLSAYCASKGAIESFAKCMNLEHSKTGVTFHLLHPPLTDTRSAEPLPVPKEFKEPAKKVGENLARRLKKKRFIITASARDTLMVRISYLMALPMGRFLSKMSSER